MSRFRIPGEGRVDHSDPVRFTFDGEPIDGLRGDTVASALLANGIHLIGRSFEYHRPRGIVSAGSEEPNALLGTERGGPERFEPNTRATMQEIWNGLRTESQNRWPSLRFDVGAVDDRLSRLFPAGFWYKTFMWPRSVWDRVYEPLIRRAAGLERSPTVPDADHYASRWLHCEVLVVGAGPAGLAAALSAGRAGARVVLVDEHAEPGGTLLSEPHLLIDGRPGTGSPPRSPNSRRCPMCGSCAGRLPSATTTGTWWPSASACPTFSPRRRPTPRGNGSGGCGPVGSSWRKARSRSRSSSTETIDPASCSRARRRPSPTASA